MEMQSFQSISVKELNQYSKLLLERDPYFQNLWVLGEISNLKTAVSGHIYFTLKDDEAAVSVAFFRTYASAIGFPLKNGMQVIIRGKVSIYEKTGGYQLYGQKIQEFGQGNIQAKLEALKEKLRLEGLFDGSRKKPLPDRIRRIGIVTSATGAVVHDIATVVNSRNPFTELILYPVAVQGMSAPQEIIAGIQAFNRYGMVDVLIVGRGGGSGEDLMAFNDEGVVRAVAASVIPIISAVGHDTDNPLCDYAADIRGATPSQAAELATENIEDRWYWVMDRMRNALVRQDRRVNEQYQGLDLKLEKLKAYLVRGERLKEELLKVQERLVQNMAVSLKDQELKLRHLGEKLHLVSPLSLLSKGYAIVSDEQGRILRQVARIDVGDGLDIRLFDGHLNCRVTGKGD